MIRRIIPFAAALAFIGADAGAQYPTGQQPVRTGMQADTGSQKKVISDLIQKNEAEIRAAQEALEKSRSEQVREYALQMRDDHIELNKKLRQLSEKQNIDFTPEEERRFYMAPMHTGMGAMGGVARGQMSESNFDSTFMADQVVKHREVAQLIETETAKPAGDSELHALLHEALPKVQEHMRQAQMIASSSAIRGRADTAWRGDTTGVRGDVRRDTTTTQRDTTGTRRDTIRTRDTTTVRRRP